MVKIVDGILAINKDAKVNITGKDIDTCTIEFIEGTVEISKADIKAKMAELETDYDNKKYQRDRAAEYPSIVDQLDDLYHNGIDGWKATIKTTKDKYPKS